MRKVCRKCLALKNEKSFYGAKANKDGFQTLCKICHNKEVKENILKNYEYYKNKMKIRSMLPKNVEARRVYALSERGIEAVARFARSRNGKKSMKKYLSLNPIKRKCVDIIHTKVRRNKIEKPNKCSSCNIKKEKKEIHGHHDDYSKPLEIRWLCCGCHKKWHKENGKGLNG